MNDGVAIRDRETTNKESCDALNELDGPTRAEVSEARVAVQQVLGWMDTIFNCDGYSWEWSHS